MVPCGHVSELIIYIYTHTEASNSNVELKCNNGRKNGCHSHVKINYLACQTTACVLLFFFHLFFSCLYEITVHRCHLDIRTQLFSCCKTLYCCQTLCFDVFSYSHLAKTLITTIK